MMTDENPLGDPPPPGEGGDSSAQLPGDPPPPGDGGLESIDTLESVVPGDPPPPGDDSGGDPPPPGDITK